MNRLLLPLLLLSSCLATDPSATLPTPVFAQTPTSTTTTATRHLHMELRMFPDPPVRGNLTAQLHVVDHEGAPVDGLELTVEPWMPTRGHGTSVAPEVTPVGDGRYEVSRLVLFMQGQWELRVLLTPLSTENAASAAPSDTAVVAFSVQ